MIFGFGRKKVMRSIGSVIFIMAVAISSSGIGKGQEVGPTRLTAPTYYIAVDVKGYDGEDTIRFSGASNLPPGALIGFTVADFLVDAWKDYSDEVFVPVEQNGFFAGTVRLKQGAPTSHNLLLRADFRTFLPQQPEGVLRILGKNGRNLGGIENPQLFQVSGPNFGLETIARVQRNGR
jgi:hypothetical protein